jgi:DNA-binding transcriptional MerR regulator
MAQSDAAVSGYRIGTVSKLTGISPDTLRIWERRYQVVTPQRSSAGGRLYSAEDISRLKLIRQLVDKGDTIGVVAGLSYAELQERLSETRSVATMAVPQVPCRLIVIGESLRHKMEAAMGALEHVELVACFDSVQAFQSEAKMAEADILVIEQPTLQIETAVQITDWVNRVAASHAIIVYRYAARETLQRLPRMKCSTLRAPVDAETVQSRCMSIMGQYSVARSEDTDNMLVVGEEAPPRRYSDETLARLAGLSTTIKCECPRHLAELVTSLSAFEQYSSECESRSVKDAELHAYLNSTAAHARHMFENALSLVIEAENIDI